MSKTEKVLVIDDDPIVLEKTRSTLQDAGYEVITHDMGLGTSRIVFREKPDFVLIDVMMPGLPGNEVVKFIKDNQLFNDKNIAFILFSSKDKAILSEMVKQTGALGAIQKTGNDEDFISQFNAIKSQK